MGYIQGEGRNQGTLFPVVLDDFVPAHHVCRVIDAFVEMLVMLELGFERAQAAETGRPGYNPRDLLKLYLYGYLNQIRSSRRLEAECRRNVELMWLLGRLYPDHKSIAEFRRMHRDAVMAAGAELVRFAKSCGLIRGEWIAIDGSKFRAVASMKLGLAMTGELFAASMVLLQVWYPIKLAKINPPGWSLCVEAFFCLCFPVLGVLLWKLRGVQLWMTALLLYVGGQALVWWMRVRLGIGMTVTLPPTHLSTFALGILLARWQTLRRMQTGRPQVEAWHVNTVLWLAVGGILLSVWLVPFWQMPNPYFNGLLAPIYAAFIWALSVMSTLWSRWLCRKWMVALGNASYALYLIHYPILNLFMHFRWVTPVCYLVYLGLCLAISLLSYRYFETPVRLWLLERFADKSRSGRSDLKKATGVSSSICSSKHF
jgi:peptidoglycan/LPS O-acetylase OafA/YrhL